MAEIRDQKRSVPAKKVSLNFHQGTLVLDNQSGPVDLTCLFRDERTKQWRSKALYYPEILAWLRLKQIKFMDNACDFDSVKLDLKAKLELRDYQREGVDAWLEAGSRGSICLPTGAGKTWVALTAMHAVQTTTLIVLPTLDLMNQWYDVVTEFFGIDIGILGGGYHEIRDITVSTYDSAYIHIDKYGNRFGLLIFDEIHHLPAKTYSMIPEMSLAPYRLGLTATYSRQDGLHGKLERLVGPMVFAKEIRDLEGGALSSFDTMKLSVSLSQDEKARYQMHRGLYDNYVREKGVRFYGRSLQEFLRQSAYDPGARKAFLARKEMRNILDSASNKLDMLESLLKMHYKNQVLIFTANNDLVHQVSRTFLVPAITHHTKTIERKWILENYRKGVFSVLVTSKVLNEGVDVPNAEVAIILGGSGSPVEHLQRLGRILRQGKKKRALLYELVTRGTVEGGISYRRRQSDAYK